MSEKLLVRLVLYLLVKRVRGGTGTLLAWQTAVWIWQVSLTESPPKGWWNSMLAVLVRCLITQVVVVGHGLGVGEPLR